MVSVLKKLTTSSKNESRKLPSILGEGYTIMLGVWSESDGVRSSPSLWVGETGTPMSEGRRKWMSQLKQRANSPFLHLFTLLRTSTVWMMPTCTGEEIFSTQTSNSNANPLQRQDHSHTQK